MFATSRGHPTTLGQPIPALTDHAVSVSLPTWRDNVGYEEGEARVVDAMQTGYPRFFVHKSIQRLAKLLLQAAPSRQDDSSSNSESSEEIAWLFPSFRIAQDCQTFLANRRPRLPSRYSAFRCPNADNEQELVIHAVILAVEPTNAGKQYWQHSGNGISSRRAERALALIAGSAAYATNGHAPPPARPVRAASGRGFARNRHYAKKGSISSSADLLASPKADDMTSSIDSLASNGSSSSREAQLTGSKDGQQDETDLTAYLEERYGRNLSAQFAPLAKLALRRRIAGCMRDDATDLASLHQSDATVNEDDRHLLASLGATNEACAPGQVSDRGVKGLTPDDVYLYPCGMAAIYNAFQLACRTRTSRQLPLGKSISFGFPYVDTLKILEKWGPGCHFFGHGLEGCVDELEQLLATNRRDKPQEPGILALFCEFPSNPLLRSPNLVRLRRLADEYGFMLVVDETIGNFVNVEILPLADIVVSSMTKVFSGDSNVMGGCMTLNPLGKHYDLLKKLQEESFEDNYFAEDAVFMERNSRDFRRRIGRINDNAEALCDMLQTRVHDSSKQQLPPPVLKKVYYPKYITPDNFLACRRPIPSGHINGDLAERPGFGGLFSMTFTSMLASQVFFDALPCYKGPSLGTNFTLASPYVMLAHYGELDWALSYGADSGLVRVSVGLEDLDMLLEYFGEALDRAEAQVYAKSNSNA
ncbi:uncharacterized protein L969DRAFT_93898 [Mixia osmundae IAM 14324]|uniref:Cystathionine gamma-synthase n=1 Tax=Mixia osmundae (strain CBS 9802 / IAM 14324 / JCM 22182 / KY 12970) TaxID=764103 RepID=G7E9W8_MIXOS|nr:uncharacterized protein L969DRAFT_93898 [Mixia osmundae IAM 14324]KEI40071.1 hypothetical protein L969DRAFT_93898 [Mixia osmundae IAM 14324]GAA99437.1 hypothetical protein E5Q_06136 [Mixia osmundae IAM 14324]